jgi:hypothetical protein
MTEQDVALALIGHLRSRTLNPMVLSNAYVLNSRWECDVLAVTPRYYWTEYEIKLSVADYRNDFNKSTAGFITNAPKKHDLYAADDEIHWSDNITIPKPARFFFVTPVGLLDGVEIPDHCGHLEYDPDASQYRAMRTTKKAPRLKQPSKLNDKQFFNLACKASARAYNTERHHKEATT